MATDAPSGATSATTTGLVEWLPRWLELTFAKKREDGHWFVLIEEFDITGMGPTLDDARDEAFSLLTAYLQAHYADGSSFEETLRPIPRRLRLAIRAGTARHRLWPETMRPGEQHALVSPKAFLTGASC
ncbi:MAG: hypothetical protein ACR2IP_11960 [Solirubrobacteraceae bacterium]